MFLPHSYQTECLKEIIKKRDEGQKKALFIMASGLGKTVTFAFDAKAWLAKNIGRVLYLCHKNDVLYQAKTTFKAVIGDDYKYGFLNGENKDLEGVDFLFASFQTMRRYVEYFSPREFGYIVVDESHHTHARTFRPILESFEPKFMLAATATPERTDAQDIRDFYGEEIYSLPMKDALLSGFLTPVDYRLLTDEIQLRGVLDTPLGKLSLRCLNRQIFIPRRDEEIGNIIERHAAELSDPRIIIFCQSIRHCDDFCTHVPSSLAIHSRVPSKERHLRLELFRQGLISAVSTVDCFNEGTDIPEANLIVFLRSTQSLSVFLQQLGRGLRKSAGKDRVVVLDFVANCERIQMVYKLWKSMQEREKIHGLDGKRERRAIESFILNIGDVGFSEKIIKIIDIINTRIRIRHIADFPILASEYSNKNLLSAESVVAGTNRKLWWKCSRCRYEWQASGSSRMQGTGCPACTNRVITNKNNLAATHPELAREYSDRNELAADEVLAGTNKKLWWKCFTCGHEWSAIGNSRAQGAGCPACAHRIRKSGSNIAAAMEPAREYPARNELPVVLVIVWPGNKKFWRCSRCRHEWPAMDGEQAGNICCPLCKNKKHDV